MIDTNELRGAITRHGVRILNEDEVLELLDRLEAAESDALEQARLNGMGASREAALMAKLAATETAWKVSEKSCHDLIEKVIPNLRDRLEAAEKERDALRAKIEQMEKQEPYSYIYEYSNPIDGSPVWRDKPGYWNAQFPKSSKPLYLASGAQPAPSIPEGWKLVRIEPTEKMISDGSCASSLPGPHYISEHCAKQCWGYMLAAASEAKS